MNWFRKFKEATRGVFAWGDPEIVTAQILILIAIVALICAGIFGR